MWAGNIGFDIRLQYYQVHYVFLCYVACLRYIIHPNVNFNITKNGYTEPFFWGDYKNSIKYLHLLHYFVSTAGHRRKAAHRYTYSTNLTKTPWKKILKVYRNIITYVYLYHRQLVTLKHSSLNGESNQNFYCYYI